MKKPSVVAYKGLPASGKSTHASTVCSSVLDERFARVNKDLLREMLFANKWTQSNEKIVNKVQDAIAKVIIDEGINLLVDNTNLSRSQQDQCQQYADYAGTILEVEDFTYVPVTECLERDSKRGEKSVGRKVILDMWNRYIRSKESYPHSPDLTACVICDLDGTLADTSRRDPYDASKCYDDKVRYHVADIIDSFLVRGFHIVFVSGRSDKYRQQTEKWLQDKLHIMPQVKTNAFACGYHLYMRKDGDQRRDSIVKREIFDNHIRGKFNVTMVIDDRFQVCHETWAALGLDDRLLRVGPVLGDEF